ncbi:MAG: retron system putative HNH endonuclease [Bryobacteraceae bacterium]|jgi:uncharacterized protein (TIGR02646 family)
MVHTPRTLPPPSQLVKHRTKWTARFQAARKSGSQRDWATSHAKRVLRTALRGLAHGKCVYCESALEVTGYLEIEHYVAKTVASDLAFEWTNLLPACQLCNNAKGEEDHKNSLLKPDNEDPEPYFWIHPDTGKLEPHPNLDVDQTHRANETIRLCDLQRPALCTKRVEMSTKVLRWLLSTDRAGSEWEELSSPRMEYKFVLRHMLETRGQHTLAEFDRERYTRRPVPREV